MPDLLATLPFSSESNAPPPVATTPPMSANAARASVSSFLKCSSPYFRYAHSCRVFDILVKVNALTAHFFRQDLSHSRFSAAHKAAQKYWSHIYYPYYNVFCQTNVGAISGRPLSLFVRHLCNQANTVFHVGANSVRPLLLAHSVFTR